jgi:hypothetical protein
MKTKFLIVALWLTALLTLAPRLFAQTEAPQAAANALFLPLVRNGMADDPADQNPTPTPGPTATPSPTPSATPEENLLHGFFVETEWKTSSGDIEVDAQSGMHVVHTNYVAAGGTAPTGAAYLHCAGGCDDGANWRTVHFDGLVSEIQLELTPNDQPRIVMRMDSSVAYPGGTDYNYAECNVNCGDASGWTVINVASNFGTIIFDLYGDDLPQRYFALDPAGRPRFLYFDRNYVAEPDHLGLFYAACDQDCTNVANWTQTRVTQVISDDFRFDWEVAKYPALAFTPQGQPRFVAEVVPLADSIPNESGLYYFACDSQCDQQESWGKVRIGERGQGHDLSWDVAIDQNGGAHVGHFPAYLSEEEGSRLYYVWCENNCLDAANWQRIYLGLPRDDGQEPDVEVAANGGLRIAYADASTGGLGYSWCDSDCGNVANWRHQVVETAGDLQQRWPVPHPITCDAGFWAGLTPTLALSVAGDPYFAYDSTYHARCLYQDPDRPNDPPYYHFHLIMRTVRGVYFGQPE